MEPHRDSPDEQNSGLDVAGLTDFLCPPAELTACDLEPGTRLGDITIVRLVGEGGMGHVYEALQGMPCRTVAVKVVHPGVVSPVSMRRFEYEAQILGRLTHPGIARIYSAGTQTVAGRAVPYFVMEYVDAALPITAYATAHQLSTGDRVRLFRDACLAVAHGHHKGVIHRDLKPGNLLVDATGRPKVIDFGVARCTEHDPTLATIHTTTGHLVGTLQYMCPEQFDRGDSDLDVRADVYALGVVLYELLTERLPYDIARQTVYEAARIVKEVDPEPLSKTCRRLRGDLETIVATCLEKDRTRRYSSAAELEADLGRHLRGESIAARPPRLLDGLIRLARRHRLAAIAAAGMVAALIFGLVGITVFAVRAETARQEAVHLAREAAREKARADGEAATSRQRLYVANLQALKSCVDTKNLRMARQLHAENAALAGPDLPLEMRCLAADLDDAHGVFESGSGLITRLEYSPDGGMLVAAVVRQQEWIRAPGERFVAVSPDATLPQLWRATQNEPLFLATVGHRRYEAVAVPEAGWTPIWATASHAAGIAVDHSATPIKPLAVSPDGTRAAVPAPGGLIRIVNVMTRREELAIDVGRGQIKQIEFSAGGNRVAVLNASGRLTLWDGDSGHLIATLDDDSREVDRFYLSADGSRLAAGTSTRDPELSRLHVYDTTAGDHVTSVPMPQGLFHENRIIKFSRDGRYLLTSNDEPDLHIWNADDGTPLTSLRGHAAAATAVAFSPAGGQVASAAVNGHVRVWNTRTWSLEREFMGHSENVISLGFSPNGESLASGSIDGTIRIWPCTGAIRLAELPGVEGVTAVTFAPTGDQLAIAPKGTGSVELWNPHTVERLLTLDGPGGVVTQVAYTADGASLAAAFTSPGESGAVCVWDSKTGDRLATFAGHVRGAASVAFSPDSSLLLTTSAAGNVLTWDLGTGHKLLDFLPEQRTSQMKAHAAFGLAGTRVASRAAQIFDATTGEAHAINVRLGQVGCVAASPDGQTAALATAMGNVVLVDFATGARSAELLGHAAAVRSIAFSSDGTRVATGSLDGTTRLWDTRTGSELHVLRGHEGFLDTVLFAPDGSRIVTTANDGTVRIWDAGLGQQLLVLPGQRDVPGAIAISPDGRQLVASVNDETVRIWGLSNAAVTAARAAADAPPPPAAPRASAETPRDRRDPAG